MRAPADATETRAAPSPAPAGRDASIEAIRFSVAETDIILKVTVSIGVSVFRGNRREFFNAADRALYQSKAAGKNCVHYALT